MMIGNYYDHNDRTLSVMITVLLMMSGGRKFSPDVHDTTRGTEYQTIDWPTFSSTRLYEGNIQRSIYAIYQTQIRLYTTGLVTETYLLQKVDEWNKYNQ